MKSIEKLVLVHYINVGNLDQSDVPSFINQIKKNFLTELPKEEVISYFILG